MVKIHVDIMDDIDRFFRGFPDIVEAIFEHLDVKSLFASRLVCRAWRQFIDGQKCTWLQKLRYCDKTYNKTPDKYKEAFSDIINQHDSLEELKLLARIFETCSKDQLHWWPHALAFSGECEAFKTFFPHFTRWTFLAQYPYSFGHANNYLHCAANSGDTDLIGFILLNTSINVNDTNSHGFTAAHFAALNGHVEALKTLCPLMNDKNPGDSTPLHWASSEGHFEAVEYFMEILSDKNPPNRNGCTPLHFAAMKGHSNVFKLIASCLEDSDKNQKNANGQTPLYLACESGSLDIVSYLVPKLEDKNPPCGPAKVTPLHAAARNGHVDIVKYLVPQLKDKNPPDSKGWTPFHFAAGRGHLDTVKYLVSTLKEKRPKNKHGTTPLDFARMNFKSEVVSFLMKHNC